ncbi:ParB/RepB/Spo0J family partition protein [Paracandidimonas soli]|uniref:ParB/RepB/Spo0J family partition protein n=1 Tax=Paracandidimonas soli TaxID=1917182 RepID=A0A4R3USY0_9BURK|nr:ParB/RepB/Spo0J family partition protein [Paracandidimonas soli]TCU93920.1 ParB/RepB/Spo0J family partition protein [Paracandidimonas soli]
MSESNYPLILTASTRPSKTNPRKTFNQASLDELKESIKTHGVLQPILARERTDPDGTVWYEIIAGERRWRASVAAGLEHIPANIIAVDDLQMLEMQIIENLQREDIHPLEEAESYESLLAQHKDDPDYSVDQVAAKLGKSRAFIYARLKLCALQPKARTAFYEDKISPSVALLLARIPVPALQEQALKEVTQGRWGNSGPMSYREAARHVQDNYMTRLDQAPFKPSDETLHPAAGACSSCPKRTGANPDLFSDVSRADVCTDPTCYNQKVTLHRDRIRAAAVESGKKVITGKEAQKIRPYQYGDMKGYIPTNDSPWWMGSDKSLKKVLGKDMPETVLIECPHKGDLIEAIPEDKAKEALKAKGITISRASSSSSASEREKMKKAKAEREYRRQLLAQIHQAARTKLEGGTTLSVDEMRLIAQKMYRDLAHDWRPAVADLWGWPNREVDTAQQQIDGMEPAELALLMLSCALAPETYVSQYSVDGSKPTDLLLACERYGIDPKAIKRKMQPAPAKKAPVKKPAAKKTNLPAVRYQHPETGDTWTGRGKPPRWIVAAEESGQSRDDFLVPTPATRATEPTATEQNNEIEAAA